MRAIAYVESKSGEKGATQYLCYKKVLNGYHVSNSTFNENIIELERKLMVTPYDSKKESIHNPNYFTITDIGQVAWLRHFNPLEHYEIVKELFPDIQLSQIDLIIDSIEHVGIKHIRDRFASGILKIALDSFHLEDSSLLSLNVEERIELSESFGLMTTSYIRTYPVINMSMSKQFKKADKRFMNFDQLDIGLVDRVTFLFYYNLIQSVTDTSYLVNMSKGFPVKSNLYTMMKDNKFGSVKEMSGLPTAIMKKRKDILKLINSNDKISKIMKDNLEQLKKYKSRDFQEISDMFLK